MALERQGETFAPPVPDVILSSRAPGGLRSAIAYAHQLRDKGVSVALLYGLTAEELHQRVDSGEASAAVYLNGSVFEAVRKGGVLMEQPVITFALAKGRLAEQAFDLLEQLGIDCSEPRNPGRQLVLWDERKHVRFDPSSSRRTCRRIVDHGVADLGIVGKDTLLEAGRELYEVLDLGFGKCRLCIAGYPGEQGGSVNRATFRVATKYPNIARSYYDSKGQTIEIIELHGSVELGPVIGLSDVILDIVESGSTLRANGLTVLEDICDVSARLVVNRVAMKTKRERIRQIIDGLGALLAVKQEGQA